MFYIKPHKPSFNQLNSNLKPPSSTPPTKQIIPLMTTESEFDFDHSQLARINQDLQKTLEEAHKLRSNGGLIKSLSKSNIGTKQLSALLQHKNNPSDQESVSEKSNDSNGSENVETAFKVRDLCHALIEESQYSVSLKLHNLVLQYQRFRFEEMLIHIGETSSDINLRNRIQKIVAEHQCPPIPSNQSQLGLLSPFINSILKMEPFQDEINLPPPGPGPVTEVTEVKKNQKPNPEGSHYSYPHISSPQDSSARIRRDFIPNKQSESTLETLNPNRNVSSKTCSPFDDFQFSQMENSFPQMIKSTNSRDQSTQTTNVSQIQSTPPEKSPFHSPQSKIMKSRSIMTPQNNSTNPHSFFGGSHLGNIPSPDAIPVTDNAAVLLQQYVNNFDPTEEPSLNKTGSSPFHFQNSDVQKPFQNKNSSSIRKNSAFGSNTNDTVNTLQNSNNPFSISSPMKENTIPFPEHPFENTLKPINGQKSINQSKSNSAHLQNGNIREETMNKINQNQFLSSKLSNNSNIYSQKQQNQQFPHNPTHLENQINLQSNQPKATIPRLTNNLGTIGSIESVGSLGTVSLNNRGNSQIQQDSNGALYQFNNNNHFGSQSPLVNIVRQFRPRHQGSFAPSFDATCKLLYSIDSNQKQSVTVSPIPEQWDYAFL